MTGERTFDKATIPIAAALAVILASGSLKAEPPSPDDPLYNSKGSWEQDYDDQWGLKRIGFTEPGGGKSAWEIGRDTLHPVVVAVIDTGIDYFHPDLSRETVWRNPNEMLNEKDDDGNGYVDDVIGWDFVDRDNNPFDSSGHGTHIAGIIAAATGNGEGVAGINPAARIMPLKVMNFLGRGHGSRIAEAIFYAVDNGARVINLSVGSEELTGVERKALKYASIKGVMVVVAAGNQGTNTSDYGMAGLEGVITVAATDIDDKRAGFSNWGKDVKIAAPGLEILSLRARRTDFLLMTGAENYEAESAFVGAKGAYYRASGTSFSAPFVTGVASLLFSKNPELTAEQVTRMILHSAKDIEVPGVDQRTGYGLLDAPAAFSADPKFFVEAHIDGLRTVKKSGKLVVEVSGTVDADRFKRAWIEIGKGKDPKSWKKVSKPIGKPVRKSVLDDLNAEEFRGAKEWTMRVITEHKNGARREARFNLKLG